MTVILLKNLSKYFRVLNRHSGLRGAFRDLFSNDYKLIKAVDEISFTIEPGEIVGYIGPNGAGKSTTIKMMTGVLKPTEGIIQVNGRIPSENRQKNAQHIGVIFGHRTQLWWDLPVIESFKILKEVYRIDNTTYQRNIDLFNDLVGMEPLFPKPVRMLSLGQRTLCDIAAAFLHSPSIVFLDEPTIGLDISIKSKIRAIIRELNTIYKTTILLTTHDISDIEALCQRVIILDKGKIIFDDAIEKVNHLFGAYRTLKMQIVPFTPETRDLARSRLQANFTNGFSVSADDEGWIDITIDQEKVLLRDVLSFMMSEFKVNDIKITEISMGNVIQKVYEGGVA
jgi:ABC-2 type transport system ATP-binding protein